MTHLLIREYYDCFNQRRFADAADLFALDGVVEQPGFSQPSLGGAGYLEHVTRWLNAFPDVRVEIRHVEQRGDTICEVDLIGTGVHSGDLDLGAFGVFKPSGSFARLHLCELIEIRAGKITYSSLRFDVHELIRQLNAPAR
jgi:predicted ester cyclase